jgi:hypothetical protein
MSIFASPKLFEFNLNKMKKTLLLAAAFGTLLFASCNNSDDDPVDPPVVVEAPATYSFERDGATSVSFSGQTTRILMAEEIIDAMKDPSFTEAQIDAMYDHVQGTNNFADANLNAADKSVRGKTAASFDFFSANATVAQQVKADFDSWIQEQVNDVYPAWNNTASAGVAGNLQEAGGGSIRYINAKGLELNQAFNKGLIGALMVDQMINNYISNQVLDNFAADNDAETLVDGKNYTDMEHDWDEAYGYLYGTATDLTNPNPTVGGDDSFLNKYLGRVEGDADFAGIADDIYNALKLGRAAIVAKDYDLRNEQAEIIREKVSTIVGVRSVYYLQQAKNGLEAGTVDYASVFHDLSEAFGFIYSLQFTRQTNSSNPYFTRSEVDALIDQFYGSLTNGFWDLTPAILQDMSDTIAAKFSFTVDMAGS